VARSILIVDDSADIQALLKVRLRDEGVELHRTLDPMQALQLALTLAPDVVLLDVDMPGRSGFDVCKELKANPATATIPIIFLSGNLDQATKVTGLDLGAVDYITKPFDPVELRARVRSALRIKQLQDQLVKLSRIDELTGLWNRVYLDSRLAQELASSRRTGLRLSLLLLDFDNFKELNNEHGRLAGDAVLRAVATRVQSSLRATDTACRYGGEEFALILPGADSPGAEVAASRVREVVAATNIRHARLSLTITASIGFAALEDLGQPSEATAENLLKYAETALFTAKRGGRNRVCGHRTMARSQR
jgi:two-component system cell cycle response regulator